jgi:hypothetical protein
MSKNAEKIQKICQQQQIVRQIALGEPETEIPKIAPKIKRREAAFPANSMFLWDSTMIKFTTIYSTTS